MPPESNLEPGNDPLPRPFVTTLWNVVLSAKQGTAIERAAALNELCRLYWWPLYAFVRRRGHTPHDAQDLTQEFFARLLREDFLRAVDRAKGKFRSYLLARMGNFLKKDWRRAKAQKRGGEFTFVSINDDSAEKPYLQVPASDLSPEQLYEQQWAIKLFGQALIRLREWFIAEGNENLFKVIKIFLTGEKPEATYAELAARLGTSVGALKMAVRRMIRRYRRLLRAEIAKTVSDPAEIQEELRALARTLKL